MLSPILLVYFLLSPHDICKGAPAGSKEKVKKPVTPVRYPARIMHQYLTRDIKDQGYLSRPHGFYDATGSGDLVYGRWVGGFGPKQKGAFWSVAQYKDGKFVEYSPKPGNAGSLKQPETKLLMSLAQAKACIMHDRWDRYTAKEKLEHPNQIRCAFD